MYRRVLFVKMLLVYCTIESHVQTQARCKDDATLTCAGIDSMDFLTVTWYKKDNGKDLGIIMFDKKVMKAWSYNFSRPADFGENYSLRLPGVTPSDSGIYECFIGADVGFQNQRLGASLSVEECTTELTTHTNMLNSTLESPPHKWEEELPFTWILICSSAVGLAKIMLSLIGIWVTRAFCIWSSRRQRWRQQW